MGVLCAGDNFLCGNVSHISKSFLLNLPKNHSKGDSEVTTVQPGNLCSGVFLWFNKSIAKAFKNYFFIFPSFSKLHFYFY